MNVNEICQLLEKAKAVGLSALEFEGLKVTFNLDNFKVQSVQGIQVAKDDDGQPLQIKSDQSFSFVNPMLNPMTNDDIKKIFGAKDPLADLSPDEVLYAATPYFDDLQKKKEDHQNKLNEEFKK